MGIHVEFVGLAGVGKTQLVKRLTESLERGVVDVRAQRPRIVDLACAVRAGVRTLPLFLFVLSRGPATVKELLGLLRLVLVYAMQEDLARRRSSEAAVVISDEGWFQKLRRTRRNSRKPFHYGDLPASVRARIFDADIVVFLTADTETILARRLQRDGMAVTPHNLAQARLSLHRDPVQEEADTRKDLAQFHDDTGRPVVHIHNEGELDLTPLLTLIERAPQRSAPAPAGTFPLPAGGPTR